MADVEVDWLQYIYRLGWEEDGARVELELSATMPLPHLEVGRRFYVMEGEHKGKLLLVTDIVHRIAGNGQINIAADVVLMCELEDDRSGSIVGELD
jgi:hypothetical protein